MTNFNFTCPHCGQPTTVTDPNYFEHWEILDMENPVLDRILDSYDEKELNNYSDEEKEDIIRPTIGVLSKAITCPNVSCNRLWLHHSLWSADNLTYSNRWDKDTLLFEWQLLPGSESIVLPTYIPKAIQEDYYEACKIRDLSPKASATLSRRCIQGMIRDFFGITKNRLIDEINELEDVVDPLVWDAINAVRSVGNIGAHMEKDIDLIIDVESNEAQLLIELIEQLIADWYINRYEKERRLNQIKKIADAKNQAKKAKCKE